jgi:hypothetical protein
VTLATEGWRCITVDRVFPFAFALQTRQNKDPSDAGQRAAFTALSAPIRSDSGRLGVRSRGAAGACVPQAELSSPERVGEASPVSPLELSVPGRRPCQPHVRGRGKRERGRSRFKSVVVRTRPALASAPVFRERNWSLSPGSPHCEIKRKLGRSPVRGLDSRSPGCRVDVPRSGWGPAPILPHRPPSRG